MFLEMNTVDDDSPLLRAVMQLIEKQGFDTALETIQKACEHIASTTKPNELSRHDFYMNCANEVERLRQDYWMRKGKDGNH
jgi:hypothetical protein